MIHRHSKIQIPRRNTGLKTILWVLLLSGIVALCGCHGDLRIVIMIMPIGYMLSTIATMEREEPDFPHGTGGYLQQFCNCWQMTRAGIVICGDAATAPRLFVPWCSIRKACKKQNCIFLKIKNSDSAFLLPCDECDLNDHLNRIQAQLAAKQPAPAIKGTEDDVIISFSRFLPHGAGISHSLVWLAIGCGSPFVLTDGAWIGALCFALAVAFYLPQRNSCEINYWDEDITFGDEIRRTKRGLHIRCSGGWHYFQPWQGFGTCTRIAANAVALNLPGNNLCIVIPYTPENFPLLAEAPGKSSRKAWSGLRILLILLALAAGLLWQGLWN